MDAITLRCSALRACVRAGDSSSIVNGEEFYLYRLLSNWCPYILAVGSWAVSPCRLQRVVLILIITLTVAAHMFIVQRSNHAQV